MIRADRVDTVEICEQKLFELRRHFFESPGGMELASEGLPSLMNTLRVLVADAEERSKTVLGQALHFSSLCHCHWMNYGACLQETREVIEYAYELDAVDMQAAALIQQGMLYSYQLLPCQRLSVFHRAMQLLDKVQSPLIRACVLYGYAESLAASGQVELAGGQRSVEAERHFGLAESLSLLDHDPGHAYIWQNSVTRAIHRARFFVAWSRSREAVEVLTSISSQDATPDNIEVLSLLAQAYTHLVLLRRQGEDSLEHACFSLQVLVDAAKRMGSVLHHAQAQIHYEFLMQSKWHREVSQRLSHVVAF